MTCGCRGSQPRRHHPDELSPGYRARLQPHLLRIDRQGARRGRSAGADLRQGGAEAEHRQRGAGLHPLHPRLPPHDQAALLRFTQEIEQDIQRICAEMGIEAEIDLWMDEAPIPMNEQLVACVSRLCETQRLNYRMMHSGAGHDSQIFAPRADGDDVRAEHRRHQP